MRQQERLPAKRLALWFLFALLALVSITFLIIPIHMQTSGITLLFIDIVLFINLISPRIGGKFQKSVCPAATAAACIGVIVLMSLMSLITTSGKTDWNQAEEAEYAVVLGASVHEDGGPSRIMKRRLSAALELMEKNPDVVVILSGGQGDDEPISEAQCMYDTIVSMGADSSRLILEDQSTTTRENLILSRKIIDAAGGTDRPLAIVTSEFHQARAAYIAGSLGISVCPVSAHTDWFYRVNYTLREIFAFVKAFILARAD